MPIQVKIAVTRGDFPSPPKSATTERRSGCNIWISECCEAIVGRDRLIASLLTRKHPRGCDIPARKRGIAHTGARRAMPIAVDDELVEFTGYMDAANIHSRFHTPQ